MAPLRITLSRRDLPPPEGVNYVHFTWSGPEVQMLLGYIDLHGLHEAGQVEGDEEVEISAEVTHRFFLSLRGFFQLKAQLEEISQQMKAAGVVFPAEEEEVRAEVEREE